MIYNGIEYTPIQQLSNTLLLLHNPATNTYNILDCSDNKMFFDTTDISCIYKVGYKYFLYQRKYFGLNYINYNGKILFPGEYFNTALRFFNGYTIVSKDNGKFNVINTKGEYLFNIWFDDIDLLNLNTDTKYLNKLISKSYYKASLNGANYILDVVNRKIYVEV